VLVFWLRFKAIRCQYTAKAACQEYAQGCEQIDKGSIVGRLVGYWLSHKDKRVKHPKYASSENYSQRASYENNQPGM
jgi:hypothetical protein